MIDVLEFWEMCVGLGKPIEIDMAAEALRKLDVNCDGVVDLQEFTTWWVPFEARMIERMRQEEEDAAQEEEYVDEQAPQDDANESASRGSAPESPEALSASSPTSDNPNPNSEPASPDTPPAASPDAPPAASPDALLQRPPSPLPQVDRSNIENQFAYIHRQSRLPPEFDEIRPQLSSASPSPSPLLVSPIAAAMSSSTRKFFQTKPLPQPPPAGSRRGGATHRRPSDSLALIMPALAGRSDVESTELWPPAALPRASLATPCDRESNSKCAQGHPDGRNRQPLCPRLQRRPPLCPFWI